MPEKQSQFAYLTETLEYRIGRLDNSVNWYRRRFFISKMTTVVISGAVTTLAGTKGSWLSETTSSNWILVLSAIITIVSAWAAFFAPRETWHFKAATQGKLSALRNRLRFASADPQFSAKEQVFCQEIFEEYERILTEHNQAWQDVRKK